MHWPQIVALSLFTAQLALVAVFDRLFDRRPQLPWYVGTTAFQVGQMT